MIPLLTFLLPLFLFVACGLANAEERIQDQVPKSLRIMIDPGHGGQDSGAVHHGVREADIALEISKKLKDIIQTQTSNTVLMTRIEDQTLDLDDRIKKSELLQADLLISIHANSSPAKQARGVEMYFQNQLPPDDESLLLASTENALIKAEDIKSEDTAMDRKSDVHAILEDLQRQHKIVASHHLARSLITSWSPKTGGKNKLRQAPFYVVSKSKIPSVLIEVGYLTNSKEAQSLSRSDYQQEIAEKILKGLLLYQENLDKGIRSSLQ